MATTSKVSPADGDAEGGKDPGRKKEDPEPNDIVATGDITVEVTRCFFPHLESEEECRDLNTYGITVRSQNSKFKDYQLLVSYQKFCKLRKDVEKMLGKSSRGSDGKDSDSFPQLSGRWFTWFDRDPVKRQPVLNEWLSEIVKSCKRHTRRWDECGATGRLNRFLHMGDFKDEKRQAGRRRVSIIDDPEQEKRGCCGPTVITGGFHRSLQLPRVCCCAITQDGEYMAVATDSDDKSEVVDSDGNSDAVDAPTIKIFALSSHNETKEFWKRKIVASSEKGKKAGRHVIIQIALRRREKPSGGKPLLQVVMGVTTTHEIDGVEKRPAVIIDQVDTEDGKWKRWNTVKLDDDTLPSSSRFFAFPACTGTENMYFAAWPAIAKNGAGVIVSKITGDSTTAESERLLFKNIRVSRGEVNRTLPGNLSRELGQTVLPPTPEVGEHDDDEVSRLTNAPNGTSDDVLLEDYSTECGACAIAEDNRKIDGELRVAAITGTRAEDNELRIWGVHDSPSRAHSRRHASEDADDDLVGGHDDKQWSCDSFSCSNKRKRAWGRLLPPKHGSSTTSIFVPPIKLSQNYLIAGAKESRKRSSVPDLESKTYDQYVLVVWDIVKHAQIFCFQHPGAHPSAAPRLNDFAYNLKLASAQVIACALDDGSRASTGVMDDGCPRLLTVVKCRPQEFHKAHLSAQHKKTIKGLQTQGATTGNDAGVVKSADGEKDKHLCAMIMEDPETFEEALHSFPSTQSHQAQQRVSKLHRLPHAEIVCDESNKRGTKTANDSFLVFVRDLRDGMIQRVFHHPHRVRLAGLGGMHVVTVDDAASEAMPSNPANPSNVDVRELSGSSMMMTLNVTNKDTQFGSNKPQSGQSGRSRAETLTPGAVDRQSDSGSPANFGPGRGNSRDFDGSTSVSHEDTDRGERDLWMPLLRVSPNGKRVVLSAGKGLHTGRVHVHSIAPSSDFTDPKSESGSDPTHICVIPPAKTEIKKELVTGCAFDREGTYLATCSYQGEVKWWPIPPTKDEPKILWPPNSEGASSQAKPVPLCACDVSPDGKRVVAVEMGVRDERLSGEQEGQLPPTRRAIVINMTSNQRNVIFWHDECPPRSMRRLTHVALSGEAQWLGPKGPTVDDARCEPPRYWAVTGTSNGTICVWDATAAGDSSSEVNVSTAAAQNARIEEEEEEGKGMALRVTAKDLSMEEDVLYGKFHDLQSIDAVAARSDVELPRAYRDLLMSRWGDVPNSRDVVSHNQPNSRSPSPQSTNDVVSEPRELKMGTLVAYSGEARDGTGALVVVRHLGQAGDPKENHGELMARESPLVALRCDSRISSLHISHDGRYIATCGQNAPLIVRDLSACMIAAAHYEGDVKVSDLKPQMQEPPVIYVGDWNSTPLCDLPGDPTFDTKYEVHSHADSETNTHVRYEIQSHVNPIVFFSKDSASGKQTSHKSSASNKWSMKLRVVDMERVVQYGPSVGRASRLLGSHQKGGNRQTRLRFLSDLVKRFPQLPNKMNSYAAGTANDAKSEHPPDDDKTTMATRTLVDLALKYLDTEALEILLSSPEVQLPERYFITAVRQRMLEAVMLLLHASKRIPAAGRVGVVRSFPLLLRHFPDDLATWLSTLHFDVSETNVKRAVMDEPEMQLRRFAPGTLDAKHQWDSTFPDRTFNKRDGFALDAQHVAWPGIASSKVLQAFTDCDNADIFSNDVIKTVVEVVWARRAWPIMQIEVAKYCAYLVVWTLYAFHVLWAENQLNADVCERPAITWNHVLEVLVICFSLGYIIREVKQMRRKKRPELDYANSNEELPAWARSGATTGKLPLICQYPVRKILKLPIVTWIDWQYFKDIWNWIQLSCFVLQFYCVVLHITERQRLCDQRALCDVQVECYLALSFGALASILAYLNLLFYGRGFPSLSPIIRMVLAIVSDIRYFALVLGLLVFTFTQAFILLHAPNGVHASFSYAQDGVELPFGKWGSALIHTFNMMLGDFDMEWFDYSVSKSFTQFVFLVYMFIVSIVLLNLLIAIMADSYSRVQSKARSEGLSQKAKIMLEMLALQSSKENDRYEKEVTWVHLLKPRHRQLHSEQDWQGQINAVEKHIRHALEGSQDDIVRHLGSQIQQLRTAVYNLQPGTAVMEHSVTDKPNHQKSQKSQKSREHGSSPSNHKGGAGGGGDTGGNDAGGHGGSAAGAVLHTPSPKRGPGRWSGDESDSVYIMLRRKPNGTPTRTPAGSPGPLVTQKRPQL